VKLSDSVSTQAMSRGYSRAGARFPPLAGKSGGFIN
jgi:hypothetical protein